MIILDEIFKNHAIRFFQESNINKNDTMGLKNKRSSETSLKKGIK